jgi:hypothetical protein
LSNTKPVPAKGNNNAKSDEVAHLKPNTPDKMPTTKALQPNKAKPTPKPLSD